MSEQLSIDYARRLGEEGQQRARQRIHRGGEPVQYAGCQVIARATCGRDARFSCAMGLRLASVADPHPPAVPRITERGEAIAPNFVRPVEFLRAQGRLLVGIEIHEPYFEIACERIENAQRQERLFA